MAATLPWLTQILNILGIKGDVEKEALNYIKPIIIASPVIVLDVLFNGVA